MSILSQAAEGSNNHQVHQYSYVVGVKYFWWQWAIGLLYLVSWNCTLHLGMEGTAHGIVPHLQVRPALQPNTNIDIDNMTSDKPQQFPCENWFYLLQPSTKIPSLCSSLFVLATGSIMWPTKSSADDSFTYPITLHWHVSSPERFGIVNTKREQAANCKEILNSTLTVFVLRGTVKLYLTTFT